jgi:hypothetical protein
MDPAAKAARMSEQGYFDIYHGGAGDISAFDPATFGGSTTGAKSAQMATWGVDDPRVAETYARYAGEDVPIQRLIQEADAAGRRGDFDLQERLYLQAEALEQSGELVGGGGQNVMPLMARGNYLDKDAKGGTLSDLDEGQIAQWVQEAKDKGYDGVRIRDFSDNADYGVYLPATHYGITDPTKIRSRFAAFDPDELDNPNILAGLGAAGVGAGLMAPEEAEAAGLGSLIRRGIPQSTAQKIVSGELPMDLGSRMARAKEQRKTQRLYHAGSPELAESLELDPDAGRFGRAGSGTWMSPEPILANTYMPGDISESGTMYQMVVDDSRFPTVFGRGNWDDVEGVLMGPDGEVILDDVSGSTNDIARKVREMGYPGLIFNGITDVGPNYRAAKRSSEMVAEQYGMDPADLLRESIGDAADYEVYTVFDPSVARLPSAAFDPDQASSGNLMAGIGAGAVGAGLMAPDRAEASVVSPFDSAEPFMTPEQYEAEDLAASRSVRSPLERPEAAERRANARAVAVASDTLERLRRERGPSVSPLDDTSVYRLGAYLTENRPSEMDTVQRALQNLGELQGVGEWLRTVGEGQRTTTMQDINAALDIVPL